DLLRGRKEKVRYTTTKTGDVIGSEILVPGERGKDLVLSIDMEYQEKMDDILLKHMKKTKGGNPHLEDVLAIDMNTQTGEILDLSRQHYNKEKERSESIPDRALCDGHRPGSSIKGATVLGGHDSGVIPPGDTLYVSPIVTNQTRKGSYAQLGPVNDISALKRSSNVYM